MFVRHAPVHSTPVASSEKRNAKCRAQSVGRFRILQPSSVPIRKFVDCINNLNALLEGAFYFVPAWSITDGGGLECQKRNNLYVPGKTSLRVKLCFKNWSPDIEEFDIRRTVPKPARPPSHTVTFESDDEIEPWAEHDMLLVTAALCAVLDWTPVGGTKLKKLTSMTQQLRSHLQTNPPTCRQPLCLGSETAAIKSTTAFPFGSPVAPLEMLWKLCQDRPLKGPK